MNNSLKTPVLLIIFNRMDTTEQVFESIRQARPERLYIAADGPRPDVEDDKISCLHTRTIIERIDWPCRLTTLFRDENLGTKYGIIAALDWFFELEEEGIILEHDCLPGADFFNFCSETLAHYRHDSRIMHISGCNLQFGRMRGDASFYFSAISSIWGWASWRRVWKLYNAEMPSFLKFVEQDQIINIFPDRKTADWVTDMAMNVYEKRILTWDYPLCYAIGINNGLCITPNVNLVSNIGFGDKAIHTRDSSHAHANIPTVAMLEITYPEFLIPNKQADLYQLALTIDNIKTLDVNGGKKHKKLNLLQRIKRRLIPV